MIYRDCTECGGSGKRRRDYDRDCISCDLLTACKMGRCQYASCDKHSKRACNVIYLEDYR